jgi:hypothetical protein
LRKRSVPILDASLGDRAKRQLAGDVESHRKRGDARQHARAQQAAPPAVGHDERESAIRRLQQTLRDRLALGGVALQQRFACAP